MSFDWTIVVFLVCFFFYFLEFVSVLKLRSIYIFFLYCQNHGRDRRRYHLHMSGFWGLLCDF